MRKRQPKVIGPAVRKYRLELGMTQHQIAEIVDVAPETLSRIERNKLAASLALTQRLADTFEVKIEDLLKMSSTKLARKLRPAERRLLAVVRQLDEAQIDDIVRALRILFDVAARHHSRVR